MDFEAIPLYDKKYYAGQTSEEFRNFKNKYVLQIQKKRAWDINSGAIKMYGTCQGKRVCLKKSYK